MHMQKKSECKSHVKIIIIIIIIIIINEIKRN